MDNVVTYARFSTDHQNPKSVDDQLAEINVFARRNGYRIVEQFSDKGISGQVEDRKGYLALLDAIRRGAAKIIMAESLDRLTRDQEHSARLRKLCRYHGVKITTLMDGVLDARMIGFRSLMSEEQIETLRKQVHRGQRANVANGLSGGGQCYGYRVRIGPDGWALRGQRVIHEGEAAIVRRITTEYIAGKSPMKIAADLNSEGVPSPRGRHWKQNTINGNAARGTGILNNELYRGVLVWNRLEYRRNPDTDRRTPVAHNAQQIERVKVPSLRIVE